MYESGFNKICNYVIGVVADEETKIERIKERDKLNLNQIKKRLETQKDEEFFKSKADFIIENPKRNRYINLVKDTLKVIHKIKDETINKK